MRRMRPLSERHDRVLAVLGFLLGIGVASWFGWSTGDLVWSLWLSSLVIGYLSIVSGIAAGDAAPPGKLFQLLFFSVHFGLFHFVHSMFLNSFFPVSQGAGFGPGAFGYRLVFLRYWPWLLPAAIAERRALLAPWLRAAGEARPSFHPGRPYANVLRMHLMIFFFAGAAAVGLDNFAVYAVVYAVYFWPRRSAPGADGRDGGGRKPTAAAAMPTPRG